MIMGRQGGEKKVILKRKRGGRDQSRKCFDRRVGGKAGVAVAQPG